MSTKIWTYESIAKSSKAELEIILRTCKAPDLEQLNGYIYCGWNHEWRAYLSGEKFKKGFMKRNGGNFGFNETVIQDKDGYGGEWKQHINKNGKPSQLGYFRTQYVKDVPPINIAKPYPNTAFFSYNGLNPWYTSFFTWVKDFVVLPNEGDHSLLLCKAYMRIFPFLNIFYSYFPLGYPEKIKYLPW